MGQTHGLCVASLGACQAKKKMHIASWSAEAAYFHGRNVIALKGKCGFLQTCLEYEGLLYVQPRQVAHAKIFSLIYCQPKRR